MSKIIAAIFSVTLIVLVLGLNVSTIAAEERNIILKGREQVTVTRSRVTLSDICDFQLRAIGFDEGAVALKKLDLGESPAPGEERVIRAEQIVSSLKDHGVDLSKVGYAFPKSITIKRASRTLGLQEIQELFEKALHKEDRQAAIKEVLLDSPVMVSPDAVELDAQILNTTKPGHLSFDLTVKEREDGRARNFIIDTMVDEWREIPVAGRALSKGAMIDDSDIVMARLNTASLPPDSASKQEELVGMRLNQDIKYGEVFRLKRLVVPPTIARGEDIIMRYSQPFFQATATGVALENGAMGQTIRIRNSNSKKIISGVVVEPGVVEVK